MYLDEFKRLRPCNGVGTFTVPVNISVSNQLVRMDIVTNCHCCISYLQFATIKSGHTQTLLSQCISFSPINSAHRPTLRFLQSSNHRRIYSQLSIILSHFSLLHIFKTHTITPLRLPFYTIISCFCIK